MPSIAAIGGGCFGAALALAFDPRIATPTAHVVVPPARLGIAYPAEDLARLAFRIGRGETVRLLFTAGTIDAKEDAVARHIAGNDGDAVRLLERMLVTPGDAGHDTAVDACFAGDAVARGPAALGAWSRK